MTAQSTPDALVESKAASAVLRAGTALSRGSLCVAAAALLVVVLINACNVVSRYVLLSPLPWAEEVMLYLMIVGVFSGALAVTWEKSQIHVDAFINLATGRLRQAAEWIGVLISLLVLLPVGWASAEAVLLLREFDQRSDAMDLPMWLPQAAVTIALLLIPFIMTIRLILGRRGPIANEIHAD
jgi:TRAP-type C4-dicarboxylate transport system permease small subunit